VLARLQKILSAAGVASRRASEQLILEGRVTVNGETIRIKTDVVKRYIALYKPKGYVTTRKDPEGRRTVMDLIDDSQYIYPVGRLDYDTEGLVLMTSDGDLAARLMHPRHEVDKEYEVIVLGVPDARAIDKLKKGVYIEGGRTSPARVHVGATVKGARPTTKLNITIHEGRNRQIRKMCSTVGLPVRELRRVRMGPITLGRLKPGQWRDLTPQEVRSLSKISS
jgi:23S rRNA pseudouridine2605 synthase